MAIKKVQIVLVIFSIVISAGVGVLAYNIGGQVSDGITSNAAYYSAIIGPAGSETQLAMNTMYFTDSPLGTIPYGVVSKLQRDSRVVVVGAGVARGCDLKIGEEIYTSHSVGDEHHTPLTVVGILEESHTAFDNVVFTQLRTIWEVHGTEDEHEEGEEGHEHSYGV